LQCDSDRDGLLYSIAIGVAWSAYDII